MSLESKTLKVCSCNRTIALDAAALASALHTEPLQLHHQRAEHWVVVSGKARVTRGEEVFDLGRNQSTYIPVQTRHRLENAGAEPLLIVEVQSGDYLGEDDIVRFEDSYNRDSTSR